MIKSKNSICLKLLSPMIAILATVAPALSFTSSYSYIFGNFMNSGGQLAATIMPKAILSSPVIVCSPQTFSDLAFEMKGASPVTVMLVGKNSQGSVVVATTNISGASNGLYTSYDLTPSSFQLQTAVSLIGFVFTPVRREQIVAPIYISMVAVNAQAVLQQLQPEKRATKQAQLTQATAQAYQQALQAESQGASMIQQIAAALRQSATAIASSMSSLVSFTKA